MDKSLDQRLHEWLFPGRYHHEFEDSQIPTSREQCLHFCNSSRWLPSGKCIPAYSTDGNAMLSLIAELTKPKSEGGKWGANLEAICINNLWTVQITLFESHGYGGADTLQLAVALAADRVREMEGKSDEH